MRRLLIAMAVFAVGASVAAADEIFLKDGRSITTKKPVVTKGSNALITTADGVLVSVPLSEIDQAKTAEAKARAAAPTPAPTPNLMKPMTPAEAARQKTGKKAVVVLTDDAVAHGFGDEGSAKQAADGEGRVEVANTSATRGKDGYTFTGSVVNSGTGPALAISVTIEALGRDGRSFTTVFASVAKDALQPGEKSTFTASAPFEGEAASFRYMPRWQAPIAPKPADDKAKGGAAGTGAKDDAAAEGEPTPVPTPPPAPTLVPIPRPDVAPPSANAPVGNPASGAFLPPPDAPRTTAKPPST
jgi:hypothetical protein